MRHADRPSRLRGAHGLLLPVVPDRRAGLEGPPALAPAALAVARAYCGQGDDERAVDDGDLATERADEPDRDCRAEVLLVLDRARPVPSPRRPARSRPAGRRPGSMPARRRAARRRGSSRGGRGRRRQDRPGPRRRHRWPGRPRTAPARASRPREAPARSARPRSEPRARACRSARRAPPRRRRSCRGSAPAARARAPSARVSSRIPAPSRAASGGRGTRARPAGRRWDRGPPRGC